MTIKELTNSMPQKGKVEWIGIRPVKRGAVSEVTSVKASIEHGLDGDHYSKKGGKRMVTLIQKEHIAVIASIMDQEVSPLSLRRNIVVSGINLLALHDASFQLGTMTLQGTGYCHPCSGMETSLGTGGYNAMRGHGGITAIVTADGLGAIGDTVSHIAAATK
jgi:Uncharacterized protein conserved in bacteria